MINNLIVLRINQFVTYLKFEKRYSKSTIRAYRQDLIQFFTFAEKEYGIRCEENVDLKNIRSWIVSLMNENKKNKTIVRKISTLTSYFKYLLQLDIVNHNPAKNIHLPKISTTLLNLIPFNQLEILFNKIDFGEDFIGKRDRLILEFLYTLGLRVGEIVGLTLRAIDISLRTLKVEGKGGKERVMPLSKNLLSQIEKYLIERGEKFKENEFDFLFLTNKGKKLYPKFVYRLTNYYLGKVTTKKEKNPHALRHNFATTLLDSGADLNVVKELLGHASLAATQVYTHNSIERMKEVYKKAHPKT